MTIALIITSVLAAMLLVALLSALRRSAGHAAETARLNERIALSEQSALDTRRSLESQLEEKAALLAKAETSVAETSSQLSEARAAMAALQQRVADLDNRLEKSAIDAGRREKQLMEQAAAREKQLMDEAREREARMAKEAREREEQLADKNADRFKVMATEILHNQSQRLQETNSERLGQMLSPLKEDIERFRKDVTDCYSAEARERFSLQEKIKELIAANENIGREAKELSLALRGNSKAQGDWGEMVLENILENSGLRQGYEYNVQVTADEDGNTLRDEQGRGLRPDVVVRYPGGRVIVIDSKVSLTAFVQYANAETAEEREQYGKQHVASVVKHIAELADKKYQDYVGKGDKLDFVMMFVSNEAAYAAAITLDPLLWQRAYEKRVLLVSPTQLVGSLRLVSQLWNQDRQTKNALEIAKKSGQMYDKFVGFVQDMENISRHLQSTRTAFDAAMNKLSTGTGNLVSRAENLRALGAKASKKLNVADQSDEE